MNCLYISMLISVAMISCTNSVIAQTNSDFSVSTYSFENPVFPNWRVCARSEPLMFGTADGYLVTLDSTFKVGSSVQLPSVCAVDELLHTDRGTLVLNGCGDIYRVIDNEVSVVMYQNAGETHLLGDGTYAVYDGTLLRVYDASTDEHVHTAEVLSDVLRYQYLPGILVTVGTDEIRLYRDNALVDKISFKNFFLELAVLSDSAIVVSLLHDSYIACGQGKLQPYKPNAIVQRYGDTTRVDVLRVYTTPTNEFMVARVFRESRQYVESVLMKRSMMGGEFEICFDFDEPKIPNSKQLFVWRDSLLVEVRGRGEVWQRTQSNPVSTALIKNPLPFGDIKSMSRHRDGVAIVYRNVSGELEDADSSYVAFFDTNSPIETLSLNRANCHGSLNVPESYIEFNQETVMTASNAAAARKEKPSDEWTCLTDTLLVSGTVHVVDNIAIAGTGTIAYVTSDAGRTWLPTEGSDFGSRRRFAIADETLWSIGRGWERTIIGWSTNNGETWDTHEVAGYYNGIVRANGTSISMFASSFTADPLLIRVLNFDITTLDSEMIIDTTFDHKGAVQGVHYNDSTTVFLCTGPTPYIQAKYNRITQVVSEAPSIPDLPFSEPFKLNDHTSTYLMGAAQMVVFSLDAATGVDDKFDHIQISRVWPNPASTTLTTKLGIAYANEFSATSVVLYDITGQEVLDLTSDLLKTGWSNTFTTFSSDISMLSPGVNLLVATVGGDTESKSVVVVR